MNIRANRRNLIVLATGLLLSTVVQAEDAFPGKTIRFVTPTAAVWWQPGSVGPRDR